jgi:hypothetical protein
VVVEKQLQAREPIEVYQFYNSMRKKKSSHHAAIHLIAAILAPLIVIALQRNVAPDVELYKSLLRKYKGKTQSSLEKAYELDKMYNEAGPMLALGRFWAVVPWPYKDRKKALRFYREYQKTRYFNEKAEGKVYLAELLLELKGKGNKEEAKALVEKASQSDEKYFRDWARRLLK